MAFQLTCWRIKNLSTNLWRCSYQVSTYIITIFMAYSHPDLSRRDKAITYIFSPARWEKRTWYKLAFCRVNVSINRRLRYFLLYLCHQSYPKVPKPHQTLVGYPGSPRGGCLITPYALNRKLRAHICTRHNPDEGNVFYERLHFTFSTYA